MELVLLQSGGSLITIHITGLNTNKGEYKLIKNKLKTIRRVAK
jgi:hypothetical protein